jgi:peptide/nickel transport system substrate-binding protein
MPTYVRPALARGVRALWPATKTGGLVRNTLRAPLRVLVVGVALMLAVAACGGSDSGTDGTTGNAKKGGKITIAAEEELSNFNQNTSKDNLLWGTMITRLVWPQMMLQTPDLKLVPGAMADGPPQVIKQKPFTVRWKIKPEAVWSDDVPVTSDDLEYYYRSCNDKVDPGEPVDPEDSEVTGIDCVGTTGYDTITKFTKVDDKTVEAQFGDVIAEYEAFFSSPMPPAHIAKEKGKDAWGSGFTESPVVSAGPYMVKEWKKGESLTLERNPKFFGTPANLDTVVWLFIEKVSEQTDALRNGEVDAIYPKPQTDQIQQVEELPGVHSEANFGLGWEQLTYNFHSDILKDATVRQAVSLGIDRQAVVDTLMKPISDKATPLNNRMFMNGFPGYIDQAGPFATRNIDEAKRLLDGAGWVAGSDGIRAKGGQRLTLRISTTGGDELRERLEELLQGQFKEFGAELKLANRPGSDVFDVIFGGEDTEKDWDIALFQWTSTVTAAIDNADVYRTGGGNNPGFYSSDEVDGLLSDAVAELDATKRTQILNDVDKVLWEPDQMPVLPLFQKPTFLAYTDKFVNIVDNTTSEGFTWNAEQWGLKE